MYLPLDKFEAWKSCSNFSNASLRQGLRGSTTDGPLGMSSCWPFSSSSPKIVVEDLGIVCQSYPPVFLNKLLIIISFHLSLQSLKCC